MNEREIIQKAIDYIYDHLRVFSDGGYYLTNTFDKDNLKELLDILEGFKDV